MIERPTAHIGERRELDRAALEELAGLLEAHEVVERVVERPQVGSTFCARSPGRKPSRSPASTAGRTSTMRFTLSRSSASTAQATARYVLPVPAGPMPKVQSCARIFSMYCTWCGVRPCRSCLRVSSAGADG